MSDGHSPVERIKAASRQLRGTLLESLADPLTGAISEDDRQLIKFHGSYQQDDRDLRAERRQQLLEPAYQFMIRARLPGGLCSAAQWLAVDDVARRFANGSIRLTTRQSFQLHGVLKRELKATIAAINASLIDTIAACGDVNRNVMCAVLPGDAARHATVAEMAAALSAHLRPRTRAYHEIWLDGECVAGGGEPDEEPIYGRVYLPRKFKIAIAVPPSNDVDVFAHDLGFIAIVENGRVAGYDVAVGGGMGMSHGERATYPRLADLLGFCTPEEVLAVAEAVVTAQRDFGDRVDRKHARLKYTVETLGLDAFRAEVERRAKLTLAPVRPFRFTHTGDAFGWSEDGAGRHAFTVHVESGRVVDRPGWTGLTGLREIAEAGLARFRLTPNQNLVLADVAPGDRPRVEAILAQHGLGGETLSPTRRIALACVGLPTCGLAMAESERYAPTFLARVEALLARHGLDETPISIRITGCPNGCARPYVAEIALVGKAPGLYNLYLGACFAGTRLNAPYRDSLTEEAILAELDPLFARYAAGRTPDERFGDFLVRMNVVPAIESGVAFAAAGTPQ